MHIWKTNFFKRQNRCKRNPIPTTPVMRHIIELLCNRRCSHTKDVSNVSLLVSLTQPQAAHVQQRLLRSTLNIMHLRLKTPVSDADDRTLARSTGKRQAKCTRHGAPACRIYICCGWIRIAALDAGKNLHRTLCFAELQHGEREKLMNASIGWVCWELQIRHAEWRFCIRFTVAE